MPSRYCLKKQKNGARTRKFTATLPILVAPSDEELDKLEAERLQAEQRERAIHSHEHYLHDPFRREGFNVYEEIQTPHGRIRRAPRPSLFRGDEFDPFYDPFYPFDDMDDYDPRYDFDDRDMDDGRDDFHGNHLLTERQDVFDGYGDVEFSYFSYFDFDYDYETNLLRSIPLNGLTNKAKRELIACYC